MDKSAQRHDCCFLAKGYTAVASPYSERLFYPWLETGGCKADLAKVLSFSNFHSHIMIYDTQIYETPVTQQGSFSLCNIYMTQVEHYLIGHIGKACGLASLRFGRHDLCGELVSRLHWNQLIHRLYLTYSQHQQRFVGGFVVVFWDSLAPSLFYQ